MSDRRVFDLPRAGLERAHHHLAGVDPNPALDRAAAVGDYFRRIPLQLLLHPHCGIQRALGMVLMGDRRAEQGEDAIAGRLHHVPVVAMDGVDHQLQRGIDDCPGFLGIELLHQLGRALDIREQRRHRLALALDCL